MEKLFVVARCRHRFVLQIDLSHALVSILGIPDLNSPALFSRWRAQAIDAASRRRDQRRVNAILLQDFYHAIDGVPFSDAARIQFDAGPGKPYGPVSRIQYYVAIPHPIERPENLRAMRQPARALI